MHHLPVPRTWADRFGTLFDPLRVCASELALARIPVLASVGLFLLFFFVPQCRDVFRALLQDIGGVHPRPLPERAVLFTTLLASSAAGALSIWFWARQCLRLLRPLRSEGPEAVREHLPRICAVLPMAAIGVKLLTVRTAEVPTSHRLFIAGAFWGLAAVLYFCLWVRKRIPILERTTRSEAYLMMGYTGAFFALLVFVLSLFARQWAYLFGPISVLWLGAAFWTTLFSLLVIHGTRHRVPWALILAVFALFSGIFNWSDNHEIRSSRDTQAPLAETESYARTSVVDGFRAWRQAHPNGPVIFVAAEGGGIYAAYHAGYLLAKLQEQTQHAFADNVFMLSSVSGGSIGSGIFVNLVAAQKRLEEAGLPDRKIDFIQATRTILDNDLLSGLLAAASGPDLLQRFVPFPLGAFDRARALEDTLEHRWNLAEKAWISGAPESAKIDWSAKGSFWDLYLKTGDSGLVLRTDLPAHFVNTTVVETGGRAVLSPYGLPAHGNRINPTIFHLWAGARGLRVPIPTALGMSARFPLVTPAAKMSQIYLRPVDGPLGPDQKAETWRFADGGYFENSGIDTLLDVIRALLIEQDEAGHHLLRKADVRVLVIQSLGQVGRTNGEGLTDTLTPLRALLRTRDERADLARARMIFEIPDGFTASIISTNTKPAEPPTADRAEREIEEPDIPLGWMLSSDSRAEIRRQVDQKVPAILAKLK